MGMKRGWFVLIFWIGFACSPSKYPAIPRLEVDFSEEVELPVHTHDVKHISVPFLENDHTLLLSTCLDLEQSKIIALQTTFQNLIGQIDKVIHQAPYLFILDRSISRQVYCFRDDGTFEGHIGTFGKGPGEYDEPIDIAVHEHKVLVLDRQSRVFIYNHQGFHLETKALPFLASHLICVDDKSMFMISHEQEGHWKGRLRQMDFNNRLISQNFSLEGQSLEHRGIPQSFAASRHDTLLALLGKDTLYSLSKDHIVANYVIQWQNLEPSLHTSQEMGQEVYDQPGLYQKGFLSLENDLIFHMRRDPLIYHAFYHKQNNRLLVFNRVKDDLFLGSMQSVFPLGAWDNQLIFSLDTFILQHQYQNLKQQFAHQGDAWSEIEKVLLERVPALDQLESDANPLLLITSIKPSFYEKGFVK
jgi:hypothetical protein